MPRPMNSSISRKSTAGSMHHAVADEVQHPGPEDADREQMGGVFLAADLDGMPGIGPAAIADDHVGMLGEEINDLPLALIPPLQPDDAGIALQNRRHVKVPFC